jgi:hypothetical protein
LKISILNWINSDISITKNILIQSDFYMLFYTYYYTCKTYTDMQGQIYVFLLKHRSEICCLEIYAKMGNLKEKYVSLKSIRLYSSGWGHQTDFAPTTYLLSQCWLQQHQSYWSILIFLYLLKLDGTNSNFSSRQQMSLPAFNFIISLFFDSIVHRSPCIQCV